MLNNIRLALQWPKELGQFAAIALAHVWIAQDKRVAREFPPPLDFLGHALAGS